VPDHARNWRLTLAICLIGACVCLGIGFTVPERGGDFTEFYAAGKLAGSGQMYDWERVQQVERLYGNIEVPFGRVPFYAILFKPIAALPHVWGRGVWMLINALALGAFAMLWPVARRDWLAMSLCWSVPAALLLSTGQDTALFLAFAALGFRLLEADREIAAGLVFSLCAAKFHLALGIPVYLLARGKWNTITAAGAGGLMQFGISGAVEGWDWLLRLLGLARISEFSPAVPKMPNLYGLTHWLPFGLGVEALLTVAVLVAVWVIARRSTPAAGATAAVIGGLLVSHHAYVYDALLLLPALALAWELMLPEPARYWVLLLWTPIPYVALMADRLAAFAQASISLFCLALVGVLAAGGLGARAGVRGTLPRMTPAVEGEG